MKNIFCFLVFYLSIFELYAQNIVNDTIENNDLEEQEEVTEKAFHGTRIINGHSVETLSKGYMEMRIEHRFGDMAGAQGGYQNMFGFDNLSDMRIALEYGVSDDLMIGFGRSKGTGAPYRSLLDGFIKYRAVRQSKSKPISIAVIGGSSFSYMKTSEDLSMVSNFPKAVHRLSYFTQVNLTRRFNNSVSFALIPTFVHRNYVAQNDQNDVFSLGSALRVKVTGQFALIGEFYYTFRDKDLRPSDIYKNSIGLALEWQTFGHNFTLNLTNSGGLGETQFIPYTLENILKGQFRFGFCVGRKFIINE